MKSFAFIILVAASTAMASGLFAKNDPAPVTPSVAPAPTSANPPPSSAAVNVGSDAKSDFGLGSTLTPPPPPPPPPEIITQARSIGVQFDDPPPAPKPAPPPVTVGVTDSTNSTSSTTAQPAAPAAPAAPAVPAYVPPPPDVVSGLVNRRVSIREIRDLKDFVMTVNSLSQIDTTSRFVKQFHVSENCTEDQLKYTRASSAILRVDNDSRGETAFQGCQKINSVRLDYDGAGSAVIFLGGRFHALSRQQEPDDFGNLASADMITGGGSSIASCIERYSGDSSGENERARYNADGREYHLSGKVLDCSLEGNGSGRVIFNILN